MRYAPSPEWKSKADELVQSLEFTHIPPQRFSVIKSSGSQSRRTIARIHALPKALQLGMQSKPFYVIELISERFDKLSQADQTKALIHELLHVPHNFGGGFRQHRVHVTERNVERYFSEFQRRTAPPNDLKAARALF